MAKMGKHAKEACCVDNVKDVVSRVQRGLLAVTLVLFLMPAGAWTASRAYAEGEELAEQEVLEASDIPASQAEDDDELKLEVSTDPDAGQPTDSDADNNTVGAVAEDGLVDDETAVPDPTDESGTAPTEEDAGIAPASDIVVDDTVEMDIYIAGSSDYSAAIDISDTSKGGQITVPISIWPKVVDDEWDSLSYADKLSQECFNIVSSDEEIATAICSYNPNSDKPSEPELTIKGHKAGVVSLTINYVFGRYKGSRAIENVYIEGQANNPIRICSAASVFDELVFESQNGLVSWSTRYEPYPEYPNAYSEDFLARGGSFPIFVDLENPNVPCTTLDKELFDYKLEGDSISNPSIQAVPFFSLGASDRPFDTYLFHAQIEKLGTTKVTLSTKDDPTLTTTFDVVVKDEKPELIVTDIASKVGEVSMIKESSCGAYDWVFMPRNTGNFIHLYSEVSNPFIVSASSSNEETMQVTTIDDPSYDEEVCPYRFTAVGEGIATITLKDIFDKEYTFDVTVTAASDEEERIDSITLDRDTLALKTSDVLEDNILAATIEGGSEGSVRSHVWSSSDVSVARVEPMEGDDSRCRVVPVGVGECIITVTAGGKAAVCKVTVEAAKVASSSASSDLKVEIKLPFAPDAETMQELSGLALVVNKKTVEPSDSQSSALDALSQEGKGVQGVYEINFVNASDGTIHPWNKSNVAMDVRILMDDGLRAVASQGLTVYYLDDNGGRAAMTTWVDGDYLVFRTTHFSAYALVYDADTAPVAPPESTPSTPADPLNPISGPVSPGNMGIAPTLSDDTSGEVSGVALSQTGDDVSAGPLGAAAGLAAIACLICVVWRLRDMTDKASV